jgi:hypothetical protein
MTTRQEFLRRGLLAKIHQHPFVQQSKLVDAWEDYLSNGYGVKSSAELSINELYNLLDLLNGKVSEPKVSGERARKTKSRAADNKAPITAKQEKYLTELWKLKADRRGKAFISKELAEFAKRTIGLQPLFVGDLTNAQANKLITGSEYLLGIKTHKKATKQ